MHHCTLLHAGPLSYGKQLIGVAIFEVVAFAATLATTHKQRMVALSSLGNGGKDSMTTASLTRRIKVDLRHVSYGLYHPLPPIVQST